MHGREIKEAVRLARYNDPHDCCASCDEKHPWPDILVKGSIDELAGRLSLRVTANRTSNTYLIFDRIVSLPTDLTMEASMAKRLTPVGESEAWLRPGYDPDKDIDRRRAKVIQRPNTSLPLPVSIVRAPTTPTEP